MDAGDGQIERRLEQLHTWGPYGLLGISVVLALVSTGQVAGRAEWELDAGLVAAAIVLQLWWHGTRARRPARGRVPSRAGTACAACSSPRPASRSSATRPTGPGRSNGPPSSTRT
ncbi:hypothetical protein ACFWJM_26980 [Streptomyces sp. NPDC127077]|uniref:hypothetical protein n=1 Tax=Streptomyces sp. NPDC127077 TaxID=3347131 RepID=UPI00365B5DD1